MDSSLSELKRLVNDVDFKRLTQSFDNENPQSRSNSKKKGQFMEKLKNVYTHIDKEIMTNSTLRAYVPPLEIFIYEIRKIMYPDLLYERIQDLLELLANVDQYRRVISGKAQEAIAFNQYYHHQNPNAHGLLLPEEIEILNNIQEEGENLRGGYVKILQQFIILDIYHVWLTVAKLNVILARLAQYFPMLLRGEQNSTMTFLKGLSEEEREEIRETGLNCTNFVKDSAKLAEEKRAENQTLLGFLQSDEFVAVHPCTVDFEALRDFTDLYMNAVENLSTQLKTIFPPVTKSPQKSH